MATQRYSVTPQSIETLLAWVKSGEPLMHMAPVARVCHQMLRLRLGRGNG